MKILKVKKHFLGGETDVSLEAPEFENFGNRLEEMQRLADEANPTDTEEVRASTAEMMERMKTQMEEARKKQKAMPAGPKKVMDSMMLGMLEKMAETAAQAQVYFQSIHLHKDGSMGLAGHCTWDEEHGFGVRLKDGKVTDVGEGDIAF
jgi:hypothetical protein